MPEYPYEWVSGLVIRYNKGLQRNLRGINQVPTRRGAGDGRLETKMKGGWEVKIKFGETGAGLW